jgi:hypothetical protein
MKTEIIKILTYIFMFIVLGTQALLRGRWSVSKTELKKSEQEENF